MADIAKDSSGKTYRHDDGQTTELKVIFDERVRLLARIEQEGVEHLFCQEVLLQTIERLT